VAAAVKEWEGLGTPSLEDEDEDEVPEVDTQKPSLLALPLEHK
jgi:hypothetical protein